MINGLTEQEASQGLMREAASRHFFFLLRNETRRFTPRRVTAIVFLRSKVK
jgi:hypothetical protein